MREKYGSDKKGFRAFLAAFDREDETIIRFQEQGMQAFARLVARESRFARKEPYRLKGLAALDAFASALATGTCGVQEASDVVFIAIDFEGAVDRKCGLHAFGVAKLDASHFLARAKSDSCDPTIECLNYRVANINTGCLHGQSIRIDPSQLPNIISDVISKHETGIGWVHVEERKCTPERKVILVGHGLHSEIATLDELGLPLEQLSNVVGTVDTCHLAKQVIGHTGTLKSLVTALGIPSEEGSFHCAGDDAHYSMRALFALLRRVCSNMACLNSQRSQLHLLDVFARQPVPKRLEKQEAVDWDTFLDGASFMGFE